MSMDRDIKLNELKTAGGGTAVGGLAYLLNDLAEQGSPIDAWTTPTMWGAGVLIGGTLAHNRWYFSAHLRFPRFPGHF